MSYLRLSTLACLIVAFGCGGESSGTIDQCEAPTEDCAGQCVNTDNDPENCGGCGFSCDAGDVCGGGQCLAECPEPTIECEGACAETEVDPNNCGGCGVTCSDDEECRDSQCEVKCEVGLEDVVTDPYGAQWDGLEREAATLAAASSDCQAFGGRLPTATELYRVSTAHTGSVGTGIDTNELWSLAPFDETQQVTLSLATGDASERVASDSVAYRCVCAPPQAAGFRGSSCYGDASTECLALPGDGGHQNIDSRDRPSLRKSSAIYECAFNGGQLASANSLLEAVVSGVEGTDQFLFTSDDAHAVQTTVLKWSGVSPDHVLDPSGSGINIGDRDTDLKHPFRCVGSRIPGAPSRTGTSDFIGSRHRVDDTDRAAAVWITAVDACWAEGGHLPLSGELAQLIQEGLPNGSGQLIFTADNSGFNGDIRVIGEQWTGVNVRFDYINGGAEENIENIKKEDAHPYRCLSYPVDTLYSGPAAEQCNGGCFELSIPGSLGRIWFDTLNRDPLTHMDALRDCVAAGGHLASDRDYGEAIRRGLPNGVGVNTSTSEIRTSDFSFAEGSSGVRVATVEWADVDADWNPAAASGYGIENVSSDQNYYRCMWTNELR